MAWNIDIKGYKHHDTGDGFVAIAPIWDECTRQHKEYPINHVRLNGVAVQYVDDRPLARWHPDNPMSEEKWIEVSLFFCKYKFDKHGLYLEVERRRLSPQMSWRYFVPAKQLIPLHWVQEKVYRSQDRYQSIYGKR